MNENPKYPKWKDLSKEDQQFLKDKFPGVAMSLIFGLPVTLPIIQDEVLPKQG